MSDIADVAFVFAKKICLCLFPFRLYSASLLPLPPYMKEDILHMAAQTIRSEAGSVSQLENNLTADFEKAVEAIYHCTGRVVVTGVGKSAIVAQKMVATFNSTGTPALFMHAADAIHGDLGMIQKNDIIIVVSNSGNSSEIKALLPLLKELAQTIIAITGNLQSYLASCAGFIINASVREESCPNNLAPTNSTTAQMVLGDALAVCLMKLNHFGEEDFARFHPGGNIGKRLYLRVEDLYKINEKPEVFLETPVKKVINEISGKRLGCTAVIDGENKLIGIITDGDIRRMLEKTDNISTVAAKDIFSAKPKTISPQTLATEALDMMKAYDITQLIVIDETNLYLGVLHLHDLLREGIL